jgi:hypothetical protein
MKFWIALFALSVSTTAMAADADLLRCRALADAAAKLACYDAIPAGAATPAVSQPVAPPATAPTAVSSAATFGLSARQLRKADDQEAIESTLVGTTSGWGPGTTFRLANGQVWRVADDSSASHAAKTDPKVKITRNFLGTLFLEIEGINQAPRVRRLE